MINFLDKKLTGYKFIDLFAGIGGFRLALESLGANCVYSCEWDKYAADTYCSNFGDMPVGDITKINELDIPEHDILCAGFPCQAFSISGNKMGFKDSRGTLFFDVARIAKAKKPKVVFMENVRNFVTHNNGNTLSVVRNTMIDIGYSFYYNVMNAADYGVPQKRERIYMVCFRNDLNPGTFSFPHPIKLDKHVQDILVDENVVSDMYVERLDIVMNNKKDNCYSNKPIRLGIVNKGGQGERIYSIKGAAVTLSAYGGGVFAKTGGYYINGRIRKLHPRECANLMGYPSGYKICPNKNQAYKQFGNSVVIDVLQLIAYDIADYLKKNSMAKTISHVELHRISPNSVINYLVSANWVLFPSKRKNVKIFQKNNSIGKLYQVSVPMTEEFGNYSNAMLRAVNTIMECDNLKMFPSIEE